MPAALSATAVPSEWMLLGSYTLPPVERDSGNNFLKYTPIGVAVPAGAWIRVIAAGTATFERNPHYMACQPPGCSLPLEGTTVGPLGNGWLDVRIGRQIGTTPTLSGSVTDLYWWRDFTQNANPPEVNFLYNTASDVTLWVRRTGTEAYTCAISTCFAPSTGTGTVSVPYYKAPGTMNVLVYQVPVPVRVTPDRDWVSATDSVTFTLAVDGVRQTASGATAGIVWTYSPGDTLEAAKRGSQTLYECAGRETCRFKPGASGRMWVSTTVEGVTAVNYSSIVWRDGPRLLLTCPAATRGDTGACTASVSPSTASLSVSGWRFIGETGDVISPPAGDAQNRSSTWSGKLVSSGTVTVTAKAGGHLQTATATLAVQPRGWTFAKDARYQYSDGTGPQCYHATPQMNYPNGENLEIGSGICGVGRSFVQIGGGGGIALERVQSGPNQGEHFVSGANLYMLRESTYNSGLWSEAPQEQLVDVGADGAAWGQKSECGPAANWYQFTRCKSDDPEEFIHGVKAHEGWGTTGHNGHYSAAWDAVTNPLNDPMIYLDEKTGSHSLSSDAFLSIVFDGFFQRTKTVDEASKDIRDGGSIVTGNWSGRMWGWFSDHFNAIQTSN